MQRIKKEIIIYQAKTGAIELRGDFERENIWASQKQIADIFGIDRTVANRHIRNIFKDKELDIKMVSAKFAHTTKHGAIKEKTQTKEMEFYALDVILSVGYRTNSVRAIEFRKWANRILKDHLIKGYTLNRKRIGQNYDQFLKAVESVKALLPAEVKVDTGDVLELIKIYADTWVSLSAYDQEKFKLGKTTKKKITLAGKELLADISELKKELQRQNEASELFATEKNHGAVEGIVGNVMQTFGGKELYPSVESKAAHLLYFMVKNHPFTDGNKRSGAFAFVWFLRKAGRLDVTRLNPAGLTALTLLIAESQPKEKDKMTSLVAMLLGK